VLLTHHMRHSTASAATASTSPSSADVAQLNADLQRERDLRQELERDIQKLQTERMQVGVGDGACA
jgi:hypothetical protein